MKYGDVVRLNEHWRATYMEDAKMRLMFIRPTPKAAPDRDDCFVGILLTEPDPGLDDALAVYDSWLVSAFEVVP